MPRSTGRRSLLQVRQGARMSDLLSGKVLIVGAGPAGLSAAVVLAKAGVASVTVDLAARPGGAVYRQPLAAAAGATPRRAAKARAAWDALLHAFEGAEALCGFVPQTGFAGIDPAGRVLLTGAARGIFRPRGVIVAMGARELVRPRPGWTLPGVRTAGSIQIALKTTRLAPSSRILLAGSGPLLFAVGAQLASAGAPPVAIVEAGRPFRHLAALAGLPRAFLSEAAGYMLTLLRFGVPILTGQDLVSIRAAGDGLLAEIAPQSASGDGRVTPTRRIEASMIGLHDGLASIDSGLPPGCAIPVLRVGDCRETLGARGALFDGQRGAAKMMALLGTSEARSATYGADADLTEAVRPDVAARERAAQDALARIFANTADRRLADLPADTMICRCEQRTLADLRALGANPTDRALRLTGRFGMGACQGQFCTPWVRTLSESGAPNLRLGAARLPARPIPIAELLGNSSDPVGSPTKGTLNQ